jgi:hypothetical protein
VDFHHRFRPPGFAHLYERDRSFSLRRGLGHVVVDLLPRKAHFVFRRWSVGRQDQGLRRQVICYIQGRPGAPQSVYHASRKLRSLPTDDSSQWPDLYEADMLIFPSDGTRIIRHLSAVICLFMLCCSALVRFHKNVNHLIGQHPCLSCCRTHEIPSAHAS